MILPVTYSYILACNKFCLFLVINLHDHYIIMIQTMPLKLTRGMLWHYTDTSLFYWQCATTCYRLRVIPVTYMTWNIRQLTSGDEEVKRWDNIYILGGPRKRVCNRKRVLLRGSRGVTNTPSCSCTYSCYIFYACYLTYYTCSWLPCGRAWFSARSLAIVSGMYGTHL